MSNTKNARAEQNELWDKTGSQSNAVARPIHYLGSKLRLLDEIAAIIDSLTTDGRLVDLFAGSGTVAAHLGSSRPVTAVDVQEYSRVLCSAVLTPPPNIDPEDARALWTEAGKISESDLFQAFEPAIAHEARCLSAAARGDIEPLVEMVNAGSLAAQQMSGQITAQTMAAKAARETVARLAERGLDTGPATVLSRYYGGLYFSFAQAVALDMILASAFARSGTRKDQLLAAVLSTASEIVNTVGKHFAQPVQLQTRRGEKKPQLLKKVLSDRSTVVEPVFLKWVEAYERIVPSAYDHQVHREDFAAYLSSEGANLAGIYADPPYTREHYSRYYHVLETMCRRDEPAVSRSNLGGGAKPSRGMYRSDRHQSPFCIRSQAPGAFDRLFAGARKHAVPLFVSYSPYAQGAKVHPRTMTVDRIREVALKYYSSVTVESLGAFAHAKLNSRGKALVASTEAELLVCCVP